MWCCVIGMQGNLPASYDCFYAFENICCGVHIFPSLPKTKSRLNSHQGTPDSNGNTCEISLPADVCAPGAAGTIESLGAVVGASTVTETVDCTTSSVAASSTSVQAVLTGSFSSATATPTSIA